MQYITGDTSFQNNIIQACSIYTQGAYLQDLREMLFSTERRWFWETSATSEGCASIDGVWRIKTTNSTGCSVSGIPTVIEKFAKLKELTIAYYLSWLQHVGVHCLINHQED